jgi:hypothetical protein
MARIHTNQSRGNFRYSCSFVPFVATSSAGCVGPNLSGAAVGSPATIAASGVVAGTASLVDLNGDGKADLIFGGVSAGVGTVNVALSNGGGSFAAPTQATLSGDPVALATGQFDGSGHTDVVVATAGSPGGVSLFRNDGQGNLTAGGSAAGLGGIGLLGEISSIAVGDFTNNGDDDVLAVSGSATDRNNAMEILGDGAGDLTAQAPFSLPFGSVAAVAVGDFNGDGNLDFVVANPLDNSVSVFLGNGNGTFQAPVTYATGPGPASIVVGDFNGQAFADGKPALDIVTADSTGAEISFLGNNGSGGFDAAVNSPVPGSVLKGGPVQIAAANFSGSATDQDLVALLATGSASEADVLLGGGNGTFIAAAAVPAGAGGADGVSIAAGDITGTGADAVVIATASQISAYPVSATAASSIPTGLVDASQAAASASASTYDFTVTYADSQQINASTLGNGNLTVTFPSGASEAAELVSTGLASAASVDATYQISFPSDLTPADDGTYAVAINASSVVNGAGVAVPAGGIGSFTLSVSGTVTPPSSALVPTLGRVSLAASAIAGNRLNGSLVVDVSNSGAAIKGATVTFHLFANTAATLDGNQVLLSTTPKTLSLKADGHAALAFSVKSLPATLPTGTYYLLAELTDAAGATNLVASAQTVQVSAPFVQPAAAVAAAAPHTIPLNKSGSVLVTVTNLGNVASTTGQLILTLSTDGATPLAGATLATLNHGFSIAPHKSKRFRLAFKITAAIPAGSYFPFVEMSLNGISTTAAAGTPFVVG